MKLKQPTEKQLSALTDAFLDEGGEDNGRIAVITIPDPNSDDGFKIVGAYSGDLESIAVGIGGVIRDFGIKITANDAALTFLAYIVDTCEKIASKREKGGTKNGKN